MRSSLLATCLATLAICLAGPGLHAETHDYCVTRVSPLDEASFRVRLSAGEANPVGREAGALLVARHFRDAQAPRVRVGGFDSGLCAPEPVLDLAYIGREGGEAHAWQSPAPPTPGAVIRDASALGTMLYEAPFRALGRALTSAGEATNRAVCRLVSC